MPLEVTIPVDAMENDADLIDESIITKIVVNRILKLENGMAKMKNSVSDRDDETARLDRQLTTLTAALDQSVLEISNLKTILLQMLSKFEDSSKKFVQMDKCYRDLSSRTVKQESLSLLSEEIAEFRQKCNCPKLSDEVAEIRQIANKWNCSQLYEEMAESGLNIETRLNILRRDVTEQAEERCDKLRQECEAQVKNMKDTCQEKSQKLSEEVASLAKSLQEVKQHNDRRLSDIDTKMERSFTAQDKGYGDRLSGSRAVNQLESKVAEMDKKLEAFKTVFIKMAGDSETNQADSSCNKKLHPSKDSPAIKRSDESTSKKNEPSSPAKAGQKELVPKYSIAEPKKVPASVFQSSAKAADVSASKTAEATDLVTELQRVESPAGQQLLYLTAAVPNTESGASVVVQGPVGAAGAALMRGAAISGAGGQVVVGYAAASGPVAQTLVPAVQQYATFPVAEYFKDPSGRIVPTNSSIRPMATSPFGTFFRLELHYPSLLHKAVARRYMELTVHARMFTFTSDAGEKNGFKHIAFEGSMAQIHLAYQALHTILIQS